MLRGLIVDDEPLARQSLRRLLAAHREVEVVGEAETAAEALTAVRRLRPSVVFLDVELGGPNGFDFLDALDEMPVVIFITAYPEHAVHAFAVDATDFLLKPIETRRLAEALARAQRDVARNSPPARSAGNLIDLKTPKRRLLTATDQLVMLRADGDFTHVSVANQPEVMICRMLAHFAGLLPSPPFLRLDRSLIVNLDRLRTMETDSRSQARIGLDGLAKPVMLGRTASGRLRDALDADVRRPRS